MKTYKFDVKLFAGFEVHAESEEDARAQLKLLIERCRVVIDPEDDSHDFSDLTCFECSDDGEADLLEVDGEYAP